MFTYLLGHLIGGYIGIGGVCAWFALQDKKPSCVMDILILAFIMALWPIWFKHFLSQPRSKQ